MGINNFTEQDTKNDFERFKRGEIYWNQVRGLNEEHKKWIIHNNPDSSFICHDELMSDELLKECILLGYSDFFKTHFYKETDEKDEIITKIKSLRLTEEEWLLGIKNRKIKNGSIFDSYILMVMLCSELTYPIAEAIFYKSPLFIVDKNISKILFGSKNKYRISNYLIHQILDNDLSVQISPNIPIGEDTWEYIESNYEKIYRTDDILNHPSCPDFIRMKEIESGSYISEAIKCNMTADEVLYWYKLYADEVGSRLDNYLKEFKCDGWEKVVTKQPEIFQYLYNPKVKVCEAAIKANPDNIQYVKNPSKRLKALAITLDSKCKKYVEEKENPYPEPYYLVTFDEDLCDEGYLHHHEIVCGKDMKHFMEKSFYVSFGNLYDDEKRDVSKCAYVQPITKEEIDVLKKFNLEDCTSGYFGFDD